MTTQERFLVFQKCIGLWSLAKGIAMLPEARRELHHYDDSVEFFYMVMGSIVAPAVFICVGYALLLSTRWFLRWAYPNSAEADEASSQSARYDLFDVLVKCVGLWDLVAGIALIAPGISYAHHYASRLPTVSLVLSSYAGPTSAVGTGALLFFKTEWVVRLAFWRKIKKEIEGESADRNRTHVGEFIAIQKTIGLWLMQEGIIYLLGAASKIPYYTENPTVPFSFLDTFGPSTVLLVVGICFFIATNFFVRLAYCEESSEEQSGTPAPPD